MLRVIVLGVLAAASLGACTTKPAISRTTATLGEVDMTGLVCRQEKPIDSNQKRTVCASPEAWAAYDKRMIEHSEAFFDEQVRQANTDQFRGAMRN